MDFEIRRRLTNAESIQIKNLIEVYDNDFIPPLSKHYDNDYFLHIQENNFILVKDKENIIGFLSFKENYSIDGIRCTYINTILISKQYRGMHITQSMYKELFTYISKVGNINNPIIVRTWQSNEISKSNNAHIHILDKFGFKLFSKIENDRGENISSVYFFKDLY